MEVKSKMRGFSYGLVLFLAHLLSIVSVSGISEVDESSYPESLPDVPWGYDVTWFQLEPEDAFVIKGKPATLTCRAASALKLYFKCNGHILSKSKHMVQNFTHANTGALITEIQVNLTKKDIEEFGEVGPYKCECVSWNKRGSERTRPVTIQIAYLKKYFEQGPYSKNAELDSQIEFRCIPPEGVPAPQITWERDGRTIQLQHGQTSNFIITSDGHLLIPQAHLSDMGNYSCAAENIVMKRVSEPAMLTVYVNGGWSQWSAWSDCQGPCGKGVEKRSRQCNNPAPLNGGRPCTGPSYQKQDCHIPCPPVNGGWSSWSPWSTCGEDCLSWRKRSCTNPAPSFDGKPCAVGKDLMSMSCTSGLCKNSGKVDSKEETEDIVNSNSVEEVQTHGKSITEVDIVVYCGLAVAIIVLTLLLLTIIKLVRRKSRNDLMYDLAPSGYPLNYYHTHTKLGDAQPDITVHNANPSLSENSMELPFFYDYSCASSSNNSTKKTENLNPSTTACSTEHLYDVPHLHSQTVASKFPPNNSSMKSTIVSLTNVGSNYVTTSTNIFRPNVTSAGAQRQIDNNLQNSLTRESESNSLQSNKSNINSPNSSNKVTNVLNSFLERSQQKM